MTGTSAGRIYRGVVTTDRIGGAVVEVHDNGVLSGVLRHRVHYSPTGMRWGYHGLGPLDLARSLLIAASGDSVICPRCTGDGCQRCRFGFLLSRGEEEAFTTEVVAHLPDTWYLSQQQIREWRDTFHRTQGG